MELMNALGKLQDPSPAARSLMQEAMESIVLLLSPIIPHICHALWRELKPGTELLDQSWPQVDSMALVQDEIELIVQVNGKLRATIEMALDASREATETAALAEPAIMRLLVGQTVRKVIVVPGKIVNIVAGG